MWKSHNPKVLSFCFLANKVWHAFIRRASERILGRLASMQTFFQIKRKCCIFSYMYSLKEWNPCDYRCVTKMCAMCIHLLIYTTICYQIVSMAWGQLLSSGRRAKVYWMRNSSAYYTHGKGRLVDLQVYFTRRWAVKACIKYLHGICHKTAVCIMYNSICENI